MSKRATAAQDNDQDDFDAFEATVCEDMNKAHKIATMVFGDKVNTFAKLETYANLVLAESEEVFAKDLKRVYDKAVIAFETKEPSPEEVFGLFSAVYPSQED